MTIVVGSRLAGLLGALDQAAHGATEVETFVRAADVVQRVGDGARPLSLLILDDRLMPESDMPIEDALWYALQAAKQRTPPPHIFLVLREGRLPPMVTDPLLQLVSSMNGKAYRLPANPTLADERHAVAWVMEHMPQMRMVRQCWILPLSSAGGSGKTTQMANLALALQRRGARVLVIDADFANGSLATFFKVPPGAFHAFTTLTDEVKQPGDQYPSDAVTRRIYTHVSGIDLLLSGRGLMEIGDMNDYAMRRLLATVRTLPYDVVVLDAGPDLKARPYALHVLAHGGYGVVITQPGLKERTGAMNVLELLSSMTRPDANESLLTQAALLGVEPERGSCAQIKPVYEDLLERFGIQGLGIIPRDAALISAVVEAPTFESVYTLAPRSAYCRAMQRAADRLAAWAQLALPTPPARPAGWRRWLPWARPATTMQWEGGVAP